MSIYRQIPIKMTSNSTPEPFLIDKVVNRNDSNTSPITVAYKMFDNNENTNYQMRYSNNLTFNITLNKKIKLNKINIIYTQQGGSDGNCYIKSFSLYGINDDNTETLLTTKRQTNYSSPFNFTFDNKKYYQKYKIIIDDASTGHYISIQEIQLFTNDNHIIKSSDNQFFGLDQDGDFVSFYDISLYQKHLMQLNEIIENIITIPDLSSYRILKFK